MAEDVYLSFIEEIESTRKSHFFCFIDPFGYKGVTWEMLERLMKSSVRGDFLILLHAGIIAQNIRNVERGASGHELERFFGKEDWLDEIKKIDRRINNLRESVLRYFETRIESIKGRERVIKRISVKREDEKEHYYLIFITNKTSSNNPWMDEVMMLKSLVEEAPSQVDKALDIILGKQKTLTSFL